MQHMTNKNRAQQLLYTAGMSTGEFEPATPAVVVRKEGARRIGKIATVVAIATGGFLYGNAYLNRQEQAPIQRAETEALRIAEVGQATQVLGNVVLVHGAHVRKEPIIEHTEAETSLVDNTVFTADTRAVLHDPLFVELFDATDNQNHAWYGVHTDQHDTGINANLVWVRDDAAELLPEDRIVSLTDPAHFSGTLER
jgi:hypothetical protein